MCSRTFSITTDGVLVGIGLFLGIMENGAAEVAPISSAATQMTMATPMPISNTHVRYDAFMTSHITQTRYQTKKP